MATKRKRNPLPSYETQKMSDAAYELALFIENDGDLYRQRTLPIITNLQKKFTKGAYDHAKAVALWKYLADAGAQKYTKEFGGAGNASFGSFSPADRKQTAEWLADKYLEHVQQGYAFKGRVKRAVNPTKRPGIKRASQATGRTPTKRLIVRRMKDTKKGYFPNPTDQDKKYYAAQLERLLPVDQYGVDMQLSSTKGKTNYIKLNAHQFSNVTHALMGETKRMSNPSGLKIKVSIQYSDGTSGAHWETIGMFKTPEDAKMFATHWAKHHSGYRIKVED